MVSRDKARQLMREANAQVHHRKKFKATTNSNHKQPVYKESAKIRGVLSRPKFHDGLMI